MIWLRLRVKQNDKDPTGSRSATTPREPTARYRYLYMFGEGLGADHLHQVPLLPYGGSVQPVLREHPA